MEYVLFSIIGYLSGSVLYGYALPKILKGVDVREVSCDKNPGAANAFQYGGFWCGTLVVVLELAKAFLPVFLASKVVDLSGLKFAIVLAAPVIGHAYPLFFKGNGGKSIAASFGALLGLAPEMKPVLLLVVLYLLFSLVVVINPHFYRSIVTFILFAMGNLAATPYMGVRAGGFLIGMIVVAKHFVRYQGEQPEVHVLKGRVQ